MAAITLQRLSDILWELPVTHQAGMRVPGHVFASEDIIGAIDETVLQQLANVACLPGVCGHVLCMPDGHFGYGFPIGGVAATDPAEGGVISPGGIGFDINCGMRLVRTDLTLAEVQPRLRSLIDKLYERVPAGVGSRGFVDIDRKQLERVCVEGARWCVDEGLGWPDDLEYTEEHGAIEGADPGRISDRAVERGLKQLGTLGSGNHYLEVQVVRRDNVRDAALARLFGVDGEDQVVVMFHCGSRGFGHQVATDYLQRFLKVMRSKYGIEVPDRELACAPLESADGQDYFAAMKCALNMSFANRQVIHHRVREVFEQAFGRPAEDLGLSMVYDVAHNTAKLERHRVNGEERELLVHRKGATRAFGPGHPELPEAYRDAGQPVIIGGSMETGSYLLVGTPEGRRSFFSTAHGSGRTMSRTRARKQWRGETLRRDLEARGVYVRSVSDRVLAEEAGGAYKSIDAVVDATAAAGISRPVVRLVPIGNVKG